MLFVGLCEVVEMLLRWSCYCCVVEVIVFEMVVLLYIDELVVAIILAVSV